MLRKKSKTATNNDFFNSQLVGRLFSLSHSYEMFIVGKQNDMQSFPEPVHDENFLSFLWWKLEAAFTKNHWTKLVKADRVAMRKWEQRNLPIY